MDSLPRLPSPMKAIRTQGIGSQASASTSGTTVEVLGCSSLCFIISELYAAGTLMSKQRGKDTPFLSKKQMIFYQNFDSELNVYRRSQNRRQKGG